MLCRLTLPRSFDKNRLLGYHFSFMKRNADNYRGAGEAGSPHHATFRTNRSGYVFVMLAAVLWAGSGSAAKFLFNSGVTPFQLIQLRTTMAAAAPLLWIAVRRPSLLRVSRKDLAFFVFLGMSLASAQFTYLYAISRIQVAAAILLQYQAPLFVVFYMVAFTRTKITVRTLAAMAGALSGCYLVVGAYSMDLLHLNSAGILSGLASAVAFAWYAVQSDIGMRTYSPWTVLCYALVFAACAWNILIPPLQAFTFSYTPVQWWWILFIGIVGTILPFGFYNKGIRLIRPTHASITATLEPITAAFIAYIVLDETMELWQIVGAGLVISSIVFLQTGRESLQKK